MEEMEEFFSGFADVWTIWAPSSYRPL